MSDSEIQEVLTFAIEVSKKAGKMIVEGSEERFEAQDQGKSDYENIIKKNTADLVTEIDQNTERMVKEEINRKYPSHKFIGEESWAAGEETILSSNKIGSSTQSIEHKQNQGTWHWIVDPIDGTTNFVRGLPACCISIGITYEAIPVIGVIYAPFTGYLYWASKGQGAWLQTPSRPNKRQLPLSKPLPFPSLKQAVMGCEWGSDRKAATINKKMASFAKLAGDPDGGIQGGQMVSGIRSFGSAALSCCAVAEGALDLWHEIGCWSWDVCAGIVILQEAGGVVVGSKQSALSTLTSPLFAKVTPDILQGRKYLVVRSIGDYQGESGRDAQKRIIKSFYETIDEWEAA